LKTIKIGISRCLQGQRVRYDGAGKYSRICNEELAERFELVSVCPEVDAGLTVPRPPVELVRLPAEIRMLGRDDSSLDVTDTITSFIETSLPGLQELAGFVLTTRSPSCGLNSVPVKSTKGRLLKEKSSGLFAQALVDCYPCLPVIEEQALRRDGALAAFELSVIIYSLFKRSCTAEFAAVLPFAHEVLVVNNLMQQMAIVKESLAKLNQTRLSSLLKTLRESIDE